MRIMIVDDNKKIREVIKSMLVGHKAEFCECEDAPSALALCESFTPDWILMDIEMDGMDGITAARKIGATGSSAKVVIVTNYDEKQFRDSAASAGAFAFVSKENLQELNEIIGRAQGYEMNRRF
jgi:CheY-like chemotaxis protein